MPEKTYGTVITSSGAALIAACILNGTKLPITNAAVGDGGGTYYQPTVAQTELKNKKWEGEIANATISTTTANMIDVKIIVPADVGGFIIREAAIYSEDGTLIAVCNTPDTEKVAISEGVSGKLVMLMHLIVADISVLEFTINPSLDMVSAEDMAAAISDHNSSENSHQDIRAALSNKADKGPPQIYDLPLADGFSAWGVCSYFKTQDSIVTLNVNISNTFVASGNEIVISNLPEGFRPTGSVIAAAYCNNGNDLNSKPGYILVDYLGAVKMRGDAGWTLGHASVTFFAPNSTS